MTRTQRVDGQATKEKLLECAGRLIAEQGYERTTSKAICQLAGANAAAINYHFGSREGLYRELLTLVHQRLMSLDVIQQIAEAPDEPRRKLRRFMAHFLKQTLLDKSWELSVWARELLHPSPVFAEIFAQNIVPKRDAMLQVFSEYTGRSADDPCLPGAILGFMAPFGVLFLGRQKSLGYEVTYQESRVTLIQLLHSLQRFAFAGLDAFVVKK